MLPVRSGENRRQPLASHRQVACAIGALFALMLLCLSSYHSLLGHSRSINASQAASVAGLHGLATAISRSDEDSLDSLLQQGMLLPDRRKLLCLVGIQTGFSKQGAVPQYNYDLRRQALRSTWVPSSEQEIAELERNSSILVRFVIGKAEHAWQEKALQTEMEQHGGFLRLPLKENYFSLTNKTLSFLRVATTLYDAEYIVKADDDVFLRLDRLPLAVVQWRLRGADYIGCMKTGGIVTDPNQRWHEPQHALLGSSTYFTHTWGSIYIVSGQAAYDIARIRHGRLRFLANEDVTVGSWMLALDVRHMDDRRLCDTACGPASLAVWDMPTCSGLCSPHESLPRLYNTSACRTPALEGNSSEVPYLEPLFHFEQGST